MQKRRILLAISSFATAAAVAGCSATGDSGGSGGATDQAAEWAPIKVDMWEELSMDSARSVADYTPLDKAEKAWNLCLSVPHMKDAYWLGVNYGAVDEARALGVNLTMVEAGGYENLPTQISQIEDCAQNADGVIIGAISYDGLNNTVEQLVDDGKPVIDVINGMSSPAVTAKSLVSFGEMAEITATWLLDKAGDKPVNVAWFPGPKGAGWAEAGNTGFEGVLDGSNVTIVDTKWGDTGKESQAALIEDALAANPDLDYIVGTAVTAEAAVPILRDRGLEEQVGNIGYYFTPGTYEGIKAGTIQGAPSDSTVDQARIAVDQAVRALQKDDFMVHVGPQLIMVDQANVSSFDPSHTLAPDDWQPVFNVHAGE